MCPKILTACLQVALVPVVILLLVPSSGTAQVNPFTNEDVLTMVEAGFDDATIVAAIRANPPDFDTSVEALMTLKEAGVSEELIVAILAAARPAAIVAEGPGDEAERLPAGNGVYVVQDGGYVPLAAERVEWRSGFFSGGTTTVGALKTTKLNARLTGLHSPVELSSSPEFLLVCEDCATAFEYHLVRANDDDNKREFRVEFQIMSAEDWITRGGTGDKKVEFRAEQVDEGTFRLTVSQLRPGEYAFLPATQGRRPESLDVPIMYTFGVTGR